MIELRVSDDIINKLPIELLVTMTQPGWKTFSCKRRINEYCDEAGWKTLESVIKEAHAIYEAQMCQDVHYFDIKRFAYLEAVPWAVSIVHYGTTGIKSTT